MPHIRGIGAPTDELHPFTKSSATTLGLPTDSTALLNDKRQISYNSKKGCVTKQVGQLRCL